MYHYCLRKSNIVLFNDCKIQYLQQFALVNIKCIIFIFTLQQYLKLKLIVIYV